MEEQLNQMSKIDTKSVTSEVQINNLLKGIRNDSYFADKPHLYNEFENKRNNINNSINQGSCESNE